MSGATGQWGLDPMSDGGSHLEALGAALRDFRQHAHDGGQLGLLLGEIDQGGQGLGPRPRRTDCRSPASSSA